MGERLGLATDARIPDIGALLWGVKTSFREYVVAAGEVICEGGAVELAEGYRFPAVPSDDPTTLRFTGTVRFLAHRGLLELTIRDPWLHNLYERVELSIRRVEGQRIPLARGPLRPPGSAEVGPLRLLESACELFDFIYPADTVFDPASLLANTNVAPSADSGDESGSAT